MNRYYFFLSLLALILIPIRAVAHGVNIEYQETAAITIQAKYDDGKPMAQAQVVIYAPQEPTVPWLNGTTDDQGNFTFVPDPAEQGWGNWDVKVRQSGHGTIVSIPLTGDKLAETAPQKLLSSSAGAASGYSPSQKLVMAAAVGWGFIGTAFFFARSKS